MFGRTGFKRDNIKRDKEQGIMVDPDYPRSDHSRDRTTNNRAKEKKRGCQYTRSTERESSTAED